MQAPLVASAIQHDRPVQRRAQSGAVAVAQGAFRRARQVRTLSRQADEKWRLKTWSIQEELS